MTLRPTNKRALVPDLGPYKIPGGKMFDEILPEFVAARRAERHIVGSQTDIDALDKMIPRAKILRMLSQTYRDEYEVFLSRAEHTNFAKKLSKMVARYSHLTASDNEWRKVLHDVYEIFSARASEGFFKTGFGHGKSIRQLQTHLLHAIKLLSDPEVRKRVIVARSHLSSSPRLKATWTVEDDAHSHSDLLAQLTETTDGMAYLLSRFHELTQAATFNATRLDLNNIHLPHTCAALLHFWTEHSEIQPRLHLSSKFTDYLVGCHDLLRVPFSRDAACAFNIGELEKLPPYHLGSAWSFPYVNNRKATTHKLAASAGDCANWLYELADKLGDKTSLLDLNRGV